MQGAGEVIPFERGGVPAVTREEYTEAIHLWRQTRATAEILSREEIGAMDWKRRMDCQRKGLILALVEYYRNHERADVAPGVLAIITILSDNDRGCATVSQPTLARMLGRSESSIRDAQKRLKDDGLITTGRGRFAGTSPVIPRFVAEHYNHVAWMVGALSEAEKPLNLAGPPADCQSEGPPGGLNDTAGPVGGMKLLNPPVEDISIRRGDARQLLSKSSSTTLNKAASVVAAGIATAMGALPVAASQPPEQPAITQPAKLSLAEMTDRMLDAAGPALANPAAHPGLLTYGELQRWLAAGCDFEGDILSAIRSRAARAKPGSLKSWSYFADAVADQKAIRERPMPEGRAPPGRPMSWDDEQLDRRRRLKEALGRPKNG